jgi:hypothetical protein
MAETTRGRLVKLASKYGKTVAELQEKFLEQVDQGAGADGAILAIEDELKAEAQKAKAAPAVTYEPQTKIERLVEVSGRKARGVDVSGLLTGGGMFLTADQVKEGDELVIVNAGEIDAETFDREYLVLPVTHAGKEWRLRLGPNNIKRLTEDFGSSDTYDWVHKKIRVAAIVEYKSLGSKGMILSGVK